MVSAKDIQAVQARISSSKSAIALNSRALSSVSPSLITLGISGIPDQLPTIIKSLLLKLRHSTTSLALSFKPPLTPAAAVQQLEKFTDELSQASSCVLTAVATCPAGIMLDEWKDGLMDICTEAVRFLDVLSESTASGGASGSGSGGMDENPYLHHTALVWDRIDYMAVSATEGEAVFRRWKLDTAVVKDAWAEFKESIDSMEVKSGGGEDEDEKDDGDDDDEDDMMDFGSDTITQDEKRTVESIKPSLQLLQILHAVLPRFIPSLDFTDPTRGRNLVQASNAFVAAFDDLISALYPEHSTPGIEEAIEEMDVAVRTIISRIRPESQNINNNKDLRDFIDKWQIKMEEERNKYQQRRLGLGDLINSLN